MRKLLKDRFKLRNLKLNKKKKTKLKARIDEFSVWIKETDPEKLKSIFEPMLLNSEFGILDFMEYHFSPIGYTAIWLISESHFAIHTFPEEDKTYIQLSSCNREMFFKFQDLVDKYIKSV